MDRTTPLIRYYRATALFLLNVVVLLVLANVGLYFVFRVKDNRTARNAARIHESESLKIAYPDLDARDIDQLVRETWSRSYAYEPFTQFKERSFRGRFVNVSEAGFRLSKDQGPWPPDPKHYNVFLFGGSTVFGYGVPDGETIASYLQAYLREHAWHDVCVYNFGRSSYVSSQERVLLEELLLADFVPDLALFVDGLNEFAFPEGPAETQRLKAVFEGKADVRGWQWAKDLPMGRLARFIHGAGASALTHRPNVNPRNVEPPSALDDPKYDNPEIIARVIKRYLDNKRLIEAVSREYGTRAAFVWQPIPLYKYDLKYHPFATGDFGTNAFAQHGYRYMERRVREEPPSENFLWCADIQEALAEPLYVDKVHYTARMNCLIASIVGRWVIERDPPDHAQIGDSVTQGDRGQRAP